MKTTLRTLVFAAFLISTGNAFAQPGFTETVASFSENGSGNSSNDFWFAPIQNGTDETGKYIRIYITAFSNTEAYIEFGAFKDSVPVQAEGITTFYVPLTWELKSSGIVENKAIHVWSIYSNLTVYLLSHNQYTSDGMYCIPTQALGKDYVVAGYESLFEGFSNGVEDFPSEFTISATRDSTIIEITPSTNLRQDTAFPEQDTSTAYPRGQTFTIVLNRGQAVQYQAIFADSDGFDVTGTIIHSSYPVGVVGGAMEANIPDQDPDADHICEMMPPISSWGKTYYVTNSIQPAGEPNKDFSMYCFVSSVPNQTIYSYNDITKKNVVIVLDTAFEPYFEEDEGPNKFFSDQPFMLVQYINSTTYPDGANGSGDPAEVVINPKENFAKNVLFTTANAIGNQSPFDTYANITVNVNDKHVLFDNSNINSFTSEQIDDTFKMYVIPHIVPAAHLVTSDSGVGITIYGYGYDETYAWEGSLGKKVLKDTVPPSITFSGDTLCMGISISDSTSGLSEIIQDSVSNLIVSFDSIFVPGSGAKQSTGHICAIDPLKAGYLRLFVIDLDGNTSIAYIKYTHPAIISAYGFTLTCPGFDTVLYGTEKTLPILTVTDTSPQFSITISKVWTLAHEFILNPDSASNKLPITLAPLASHNFVVTFNPGRDSTYACLALAESYEASGIRTDTLRGIGYSIAASVADDARTEVHATLTPNPATNSATLNFTLPQTANVTFELSSMDGKTVFRLNGNAQSEGEHVENIDISSIASGSYLYSFKANGQTLSGKLIINR